MENNNEEQKMAPQEAPKKSKKSTVILFASILVMVLAIIGTGFVLKWKESNKPVKVKTETEKKPVADSAFRLSGNGLEDFDLYFLQLENNPTNKVYSPLSIKYALAMLKDGSAGMSRDQIESVIGDYQAIKYNNNEHMSFANAMFIKDSFKKNVDEKYTKTLQDKYGAEVILDPFENASTVNSWVSNKTFKLIENLLDDETVKQGDFFLVNALAIDMNWKTRLQSSSAPLPEGMKQKRYNVHYEHEKFSDYVSTIMDEDYPAMTFNGQENTKSVEVAAAFNRYDIIKEVGEENIRKTITAKYKEYLDNGGDPCGKDLETYVNEYIEAIGKNYKQADTSTDFSFYDDDEMKVFAKDLQTYDGTTLQYIGIMPKQALLGDYIKEINAKSLKSLIEKVKTAEYDNMEEGTITHIKGNIPLFKFDYKLNLMKDLQSLGISDVFDAKKADLSRMVTAENEYIFDARHSANIEFSNDGIKAAAATSMGGEGAASCLFQYDYDVPVKEIDITFDRPYLFIVRDKESGEVWFTGTVYNPTKK